MLLVVVREVSGGVECLDSVAGASSCVVGGCEGPHMAGGIVEPCADSVSAIFAAQSCIEVRDVKSRWSLKCIKLS